LLDSKLEDKAICTEWYQAFPYSTLLLISSWIEFWFVKFVSIYLKRQRHSMFFFYFRDISRFALMTEHKHCFTLTFRRHTSSL
jgi:hypothetical protein